MLKFSDFLREDFLLEAAGKPLSGSAKQSKTLSHIIGYIYPFLTSDQKKESANNLKQYLDIGNTKNADLENDGEFSSNDFTHEIVAKKGHNNYETGEKVKVTGVTHDNGKVLATTENHGVIPISKLGVPEELARESKTDHGFVVESKIQKNLDPNIQAAGASGEYFDFNTIHKDENGNDQVRGKILKKDDTIKIIRGESKASEKSNPSMGTATVTYNPETRKWAFSEGKSEMGSKFSELKHPKSGLTMLEHLNLYHSDGIIPTSITFDASGQGVAKHYLKSLGGIGANFLHLHKYKKKKNGSGMDYDTGTTYSIGDNHPLMGIGKMSHLSWNDIDSLDGKVIIEKSTGGTSTVKHRVHLPTFNKLAFAHRDNADQHVNLYDENSAESFRPHYEQRISEIKKKDPALKFLNYSPDERGSGEHGASTFSKPDDPSHLPNKLGIQQ